MKIWCGTSIRACRSSATTARRRWRSAPTVSGDDVVTRARRGRIGCGSCEPEFPPGLGLGVVSMQSEAVTRVIKGFTESLGGAGDRDRRAGVLHGVSEERDDRHGSAGDDHGQLHLPARAGVVLERISLGARIIALGMLVENAIVVVDGILSG